MCLKTSSKARKTQYERGLQAELNRTINAQLGPSVESEYFSAEDQLLLRRVLDMDKRRTGDERDVKIETEEIDIVLLNDHEVASGALARLRMPKGLYLEVYLGDDEAGFQTHEMSYQSSSSFETYLTFTKQLRAALNTYTNHPIFRHSDPAQFNHMRNLIRQELRGP